MRPLLFAVDWFLPLDILADMVQMVGRMHFLHRLEEAFAMSSTL
jgi:hypothetical protein